MVEIPGVFASFCRDLLQAPKLFQKDANFVFLAHFAVRSFELLGRNTRCVCVALCNVSRYVTKSRDMRESDLVREMFVRTVLLQSADILYDRRCL